MKLVVGLGNPDKKYAKTRHNAGFMFLLSKIREVEKLNYSVLYKNLILLL